MHRFKYTCTNMRKPPSHVHHIPEGVGFRVVARVGVVVLGGGGGC